MGTFFRQEKRQKSHLRRQKLRSYIILSADVKIKHRDILQLKL